MTIDKDFIKERLDFMRWLSEQQRKIEEVFDCDIYGGPMKVWEAEFNMWKRLFKNERSFDMLVSFASFYASKECCVRYKFEYTWTDKENLDFCSETIQVYGAPTDDNWIAIIWKHICELEEKENESR